MSELAIGEALLRDVADATPEQTVRKVKNTAAGELAKLDPTASIRFTEYFNHTFAPDIVMQWPGDGRSAERYVYLRLSDRATELTEDVGHVHDQKPVFLTLSPPSTAADRGGIEGIERLTRAAEESDTLVSDLGGLDTLSRASRTSSFVGILSSTVARGGRGLLNSDTARIAATSVEAGFSGAQTLDADAVGAAAAASQRLLSASHSGRLNRFLQAVWVGAGGRLDAYPGETSLGGDLDDDSWNFLLALPEIDEPDFWKRLGRSLTVGQLGRLAVPLDNGNFHNLVKANTDSLWARNCVVRNEEPNLLEQEVADQWKWTVSRRTLALKGPTFVCHLAELKAELDPVEGTASDGVAVSELRDRATGHRVTGLVMSDGQADLDLASRDQGDVTTSAWLEVLASAGEDGPSVKRATVLLPTGHTVHLDFTDSTASAATRSQPALPVFTSGVLPLLREMSEDQLAGLRTCFSTDDADDLLSMLEDSEGNAHESEEDIIRQIAEDEAQHRASQESAHDGDDPWATDRPPL